MTQTKKPVLPAMIRRLLITVGILSGGFLVLLGILALIGGQIPETHQASYTKIIPAPPVEVWSYIADIPRQPDWNPSILKVESQPDYQGHATWREVYQNGDHLTFYLKAVDKPRQLTRVIHDEASPFQGRWELNLEPMEEGQKTRLTVTEYGHIEQPLLRFLAHHIMGTDAFIKNYTERIYQAAAATS
jgi:uncharacterized protein YndB with AHSA1/START domain